MSRAQSCLLLIVFLTAVCGCEQPPEKKPPSVVQPAQAPSPPKFQASFYRLVPLPGMDARLDSFAEIDEGRPVVRVHFRKEGEERRFLALEGRPDGDPVGAKALEIRYRLQLAKGQPPRPALMVYEQGGDAWYKVGVNPISPGGFTVARLPLGALRRAEFSPSVDAELDWGKTERTWVGLVIDGIAEGIFEMSQARYTSEPYKPSQPLSVKADRVEDWGVSKDNAVQANLTTPAEGPEGKPCMKFEFKFPGQRHMYAIPSTRLPDVELEGYSSLRFKYKATLPAGLKGLLVTLGERGGAQYYADPPPPASAEWTTITIPFSRFKFAPWSKDANNRMDLEQIGSVMIGTHGTASGAGGSGCIWVADIEFVP